LAVATPLGLGFCQATTKPWLVNASWLCIKDSKADLMAVSFCPPPWVCAHADLLHSQPFKPVCPLCTLHRPISALILLYVNKKAKCLFSQKYIFLKNRGTVQLYKSREDIPHEKGRNKMK
jgi:hypothetical protein